MNNLIDYDDDYEEEIINPEDLEIIDEKHPLNKLDDLQLKSKAQELGIDLSKHPHYYSIFSSIVKKPLPEGWNKTIFNKTNEILYLNNNDSTIHNISPLEELAIEKYKDYIINFDLKTSINKNNNNELIENNNFNKGKSKLNPLKPKNLPSTIKDDTINFNNNVKNNQGEKFNIIKNKYDNENNECFSFKDINSNEYLIDKYNNENIVNNKKSNVDKIPTGINNNISKKLEESLSVENDYSNKELNLLSNKYSNINNEKNTFDSNLVNLKSININKKNDERKKSINKEQLFIRKSNYQDLKIEELENFNKSFRLKTVDKFENQYKEQKASKLINEKKHYNSMLISYKETMDNNINEFKLNKAKTFNNNLITLINKYKSIKEDELKKENENILNNYTAKIKHYTSKINNLKLEIKSTKENDDVNYNSIKSKLNVLNDFYEEKFKIDKKSLSLEYEKKFSIFKKQEEVNTMTNSNDNKQINNDMLNIVNKIESSNDIDLKINEIIDKFSLTLNENIKVEKDNIECELAMYSKEKIDKFKLDLKEEFDYKKDLLLNNIEKEIEDIFLSDNSLINNNSSINKINKSIKLNKNNNNSRNALNNSLLCNNTNKINTFNRTFNNISLLINNNELYKKNEEYISCKNNQTYEDLEAIKLNIEQIYTSNINQIIEESKEVDNSSKEEYFNEDSLLYSINNILNKLFITYKRCQNSADQYKQEINKGINNYKYYSSLLMIIINTLKTYFIETNLNDNLINCHIVDKKKLLFERYNNKSIENLYVILYNDIKLYSESYNQSILNNNKIESEVFVLKYSNFNKFDNFKFYNFFEKDTYKSIKEYYLKRLFNKENNSCSISNSNILLESSEFKNNKLKKEIYRLKNKSINLNNISMYNNSNSNNLYLDNFEILNKELLDDTVIKEMLNDCQNKIYNLNIEIENKLCLLNKEQKNLLSSKKDQLLLLSTYNILELNKINNKHSNNYLFNIESRLKNNLFLEVISKEAKNDLSFIELDFCKFKNNFSNYISNNNLINIDKCNMSKDNCVSLIKSFIIDNYLSKLNKLKEKVDNISAKDSNLENDVSEHTNCLNNISNLKENGFYVSEYRKSPTSIAYNSFKDTKFKDSSNKKIDLISYKNTLYNKTLDLSLYKTQNAIDINNGLYSKLK